MPKPFENLPLALVMAFLGTFACTSTPQSAREAILPNGYTDLVSSWSSEKSKPALRSVEDFFEAVRTEVLIPRGKAIAVANPVLAGLTLEEAAPWFSVFFETLVGTQLMAQSNSFRSYNNSDCYDAFARPLGITPLPPTSELMTLSEFIKAGPRIPDEQTYSGQVKLYCGRRAINLFHGIALSRAPESSDQQVANAMKIHLALRNNLVLQKYILSRAASEASLILQSYRNAL